MSDDKHGIYEYEQDYVVLWQGTLGLVRKEVRRYQMRGYRCAGGIWGSKMYWYQAMYKPAYLHEDPFPADKMEDGNDSGQNEPDVPLADQFGE